MENVHKETRLEKIAKHITNPKSKWARAGWFIPAVYFGGATRAKYQEPFAKAIKIRPHKLTMLNAVIFGVGGAALYHFGGQQASKGAEYVARELAQPTRVATELLAGYTLLHSVARVGYSFKTKKPIGSPCLVGLVSTISLVSAEAGMEAWDKIKNGDHINE